MASCSTSTDSLDLHPRDEGCLAQGTLAGFGNRVVGIHAPAFLDTSTALITLIPFGTPFVWGSLGVWLLATGKAAEGIDPR